MVDPNATTRITAADFSPDMVLVTFADGVIVTYSASFLFSVRDRDGNRIVAADADAEKTAQSEN